MLRVLVIDESHTRAGDICASLALAGHQVAAVLPSAIGVLAANYGLEVLGPFLLVAALLMTGLFELLARRMRAP